MNAHRILAVLECRGSDEAVLRAAVEVAAETGGYLTLVVVVPRPLRTTLGPYCVPRVTPEELRAEAAAVLARNAALVPPGIPLATAVDEGRTADVIARRVAVAEHDLVVVRHRRLTLLARTAGVPVLAP